MQGEKTLRGLTYSILLEAAPAAAQQNCLAADLKPDGQQTPSLPSFSCPLLPPSTSYKKKTQLSLPQSVFLKGDLKKTE